MAKKSLYKKLVRQFESTINNYQAVKELSFTKLEKIILIQKKDNRYYRDIQQFLVYLREFKDKNELIFIFHRSTKKYQRLLEKVESLLIFNQDVLNAWKCLENTYLRCIEMENFRLLNDKRQEYQHSFNLNKWNALVWFDTTPRISRREDLEKKTRLSIIAAAIKQINLNKIKKSIVNPIVEVSQALFDVNFFSKNIDFGLQALSSNTKIFFTLLFTKQTVTARTSRASYTKQTNNCFIEYPHCYQRNNNLDITEYQDDLKKSPGFSAILNRKQLIEFRFGNTIFILRENCLSRQDLAKNAQILCQSDYEWFLRSMAIYLIRKKIRAVAQEQGLKQQDDAVYAQITRDICSIDDIQQNDKQLMGVYSHDALLENINDSELEKFIFYSKFLTNSFKSIFPELNRRNSSDLISLVDNFVRLKIAALKNLELEEFKVFAQPNKGHSWPLPETQSMAAPDLLQTHINTISSNYQGSAEGLNWRIFAPAIVVPGIIFSIVVFIIIKYSKKFKSGNSELDIELNPIINSISDSLHVSQLIGRLAKRLGFLKNLDRYDNEIGSHYISLSRVNSKEEAIKYLKKIKEALTKFIGFKKVKLKDKDKDKIILNKLESALLIVESLIQRYNLLSLPNTNSSKNNYITDQLKSGLKDSINSMLCSIEIIRDNFEGTFFSKHKIKKDASKLIYLDLLLNLEKAIYETMLSAHAEGYFENYPREKIKTCLSLSANTNSVVNHEVGLENIEKLQNDLLSTLGFILNPSKKFTEELLKLKEDTLYNTINSFITKLEPMKSQLIAYFADCNARRDEASKLKKQIQSSVNFNPIFFGQPKPYFNDAEQQSTSKYAMHR